MSTIMEATEDVRVGPRSTDGKRPDVDKAVAKLDKLVTVMLNDPALFKTFLRYKGAMHNYSWGNLCLIYWDYLQRGLDGPVVTMGFHGWKAMGRMVRKGSKAIELLKPIIITKEVDDPTAPGGKRKETRCVGFEIIRKTFHIQDTDGPDYDPPTPKPMEDESDEQREASTNLCKWLTRMALDAGITKVRRDADTDAKLRDAHGCYRPDTDEIWIRSDLSMAQAAKTLTHEIAHYIAEHGKAVAYTTRSRPACEAIAEGAAFVVMSHFGYDTEAYTAPYVAGWTQDANVFKMVLRDITDVSKAIIDKTTATMEAK